MKRVQVSAFDDVNYAESGGEDLTPADEEVTFTWEGVEYTADLCAGNAKALRDVVGRVIAAVQANRRAQLALEPKVVPLPELKALVAGYSHNEKREYYAEMTAFASQHGYKVGHSTKDGSAYYNRELRQAFAQWKGQV